MDEIAASAVGLDPAIAGKVHDLRSDEAIGRPEIGLIGFAGERQVGDNWCWAAVAASLYNARHGAAARKRQCEVVDEYFWSDPESICLRGRQAEECSLSCLASGRDRPGRVDCALAMLGLFEPPFVVIGAQPGDDAGNPLVVDGVPIGPYWSIEEFRGLLARKRAIVLRVDRDWDGDANDHFVVVVACGADDDRVRVYDPSSGSPGEPESIKGLTHHGRINHKYISRPLGP